MPLDQERPFLVHLEILRWHLLRSLLAVAIVAAILFWKLPWVLHHIVLAPLRANFITFQWLCEWVPCVEPHPIKLQAVSPAEQFMKSLILAIVGGIILAFPYVAWEIWRFIAPGLYRHERMYLRNIVGYVSLFFFLGVLFGYFVLVPFMFRFFASFQLTPQVENIWRIGDVILLVVQTVFLTGLAFQLPLLMYILGQVGILTRPMLRRGRKYALVGALIVGGILTPSPDIFSQLLLAVPLLGLYELGIWLVARAQKPKSSWGRAIR